MNNISVIGVGRLGLGLSLLFEKFGYNILGLDINEKYVSALNKKTFKTDEPLIESYLNLSSNFTATTDLELVLNFSDYIFILVQTPNSGGYEFYDHSILSNLLFQINKFKLKNKHLIIGCTVMPKYIDNIGSCLLSDCIDCSLSYNPEFVAQGEIIKGFYYPDIILIGSQNQIVINKLKEIYDKCTKSNPIYCVMTPLESEIVKISLNGFITTKLSFANMISDLCDNLNVDKKKVLESIGKDSRIGNKYFNPGLSYGGPCFPRDTLALKHLLDNNNINSDILEATHNYNNIHVEFQAEQLLKENDENIVIENVCFKEQQNFSCIEESAKLKMALYLKKKGKNIIIKDTLNTINQVKKQYGSIFNYLEK